MLTEAVVVVDESESDVDGEEEMEDALVLPLEAMGSSAAVFKRRKLNQTSITEFGDKGFTKWQSAQSTDLLILFQNNYAIPCGKR